MDLCLTKEIMNWQGAWLRAVRRAVFFCAKDMHEGWRESSQPLEGPCGNCLQSLSAMGKPRLGREPLRPGLCQLFSGLAGFVVCLRTAVGSGVSEEHAARACHWLAPHFPSVLRVGFQTQGRSRQEQGASSWTPRSAIHF